MSENKYKFKRRRTNSYASNGERETTRRQKQIALGQLKKENGFTQSVLKL